jgi:hypothetical protein
LHQSERKVQELEQQVQKLSSSLSEIQDRLNQEKQEKVHLLASFKKLEDPSTKKHEDTSSALHENHELAKKCEKLEKLLETAEKDKKKQSDEIELLSKRLELKHSKDSEDTANDSIISKLNARVSAMKIKEQKLLEENARLEGLYNDIRR